MGSASIEVFGFPWKELQGRGVFVQVAPRAKPPKSAGEARRDEKAERREREQRNAPGVRKNRVRYRDQKPRECVVGGKHQRFSARDPAETARAERNFFVRDRHEREARRPDRDGEDERQHGCRRRCEKDERRERPEARSYEASKPAATRIRESGYGGEPAHRQEWSERRQRNTPVG